MPNKVVQQREFDGRSRRIQVAPGRPAVQERARGKLHRHTHRAHQIELPQRTNVFMKGALANLAEIGEFFSTLPFATQLFTVAIVTAALLIPVRTFLLCAVLFHAPGMREI